MKIRFVISILILLSLVTFLKPGFCEEKKVIDNKNEFGGFTTCVIYAEGDKEYADGFLKIMKHYDDAGKDGVGRLRKLEYVHTEDHATKNGFWRSEIYIGTDGRDEKTVVYDKAGKVIRERSFYRQLRDQ